MVDESWRDDAKCQDFDPELFFPTDAFGADVARQICAMCPVRAECLEYALSTNQWYGVWAGKTTRERAKLKRETA